ncbi:replication protein [uncultured Dokdonia sp.]|uniref:replication protein n=1 Tax=uncultured Dokdonia sp. TaxID=575653 RepID=UPI002616818F|nr:replication protein [uncultured Dokdonia sp.]
MAYINRTGVPNEVFDIHLQHLGYAELKVLLVIIRQTYGWVDKQTGSHKSRDWISRQFFVKKTGLSKRAVSKAIAGLQGKNLIVITDSKGSSLNSANCRKKLTKLYFSAHFPQSSDFRSIKAVTYRTPTIIKHTKLYREERSLGMQKISFNNKNKAS